MEFYKKLGEIAKTKTRDFLIERMDDENYISRESCAKLHRKTINNHWANMMEAKMNKAIENVN